MESSPNPVTAQTKPTQPRMDASGQSDSLAKLAEALAKAQGSMAAAAKDKENPHFKSSYADLASVWDACRKPLSDNGIAVIQRPTTGSPGAVTLTTWLVHSSGEYMWDRCTFPVSQATPQGYGSALTYLRRYTLSAMVGVAPAEDDDDGNAASHVQPRREPAPPKQEKSEPAKKAEPTEEEKKAAAEKAAADKRRRRAAKVWERAQKQGMTLDTYKAWVERALGELKESKSWTSEDLDELERQLTEAEQVYSQVGEGA